MRAESAGRAPAKGLGAGPAGGQGRAATEAAPEERVVMDHVHEFISYASEGEIPPAGQLETMEKIGAATIGCEGLASRELFYPEPDRRWIAHVVWEDENAIEASATIAEDPDVAALLDQLESESMTHGRFRRAGGVRGSQNLQEST